METAALIHDLSQSDADESAQTRNIRESTLHILQNKAEETQLPDALTDLLTTVIKPLFTASKHPAITSTGRKILVPPAPTVGRFNDNIIFEDTKPWKHAWTVDILKYILTSYGRLPQDTRKNVLEAQFHLLIPPILNMIDDADLNYKAVGCNLLHLLCKALIQCQSDMLKRTGLTEVFIDALKPNFMLLPTLTPEEDSLLVLRELYPAFMALLAARFITLDLDDTSSKPSITATKLLEPNPTLSRTTKPPSSSSLIQAQSGKPPSLTESQTREAYLTLLLRHGVLASLHHLDAGDTTSYIPLTTYLMSQISPIVSKMGISAVIHLQNLLPLLRKILCDPFGGAAPELLLESLDVLAVIIDTCKPRIKEKWWAECLRGVVGCWCTVLDDEEVDGSSSKKIVDVDVEMEENDQKRVLFEEVKARCRDVVTVLGEVVGEEVFGNAQQRLQEEEEDLTGLFVNS